jgi:hypothetical protein
MTEVDSVKSSNGNITHSRKIGPPSEYKENICTLATCAM